MGVGVATLGGVIATGDGVVAGIGFVPKSDGPIGNIGVAGPTTSVGLTPAQGILVFHTKGVCHCGTGGVELGGVVLCGETLGGMDLGGAREPLAGPCCWNCGAGGCGFVLCPINCCSKPSGPGGEGNDGALGIPVYAAAAAAAAAFPPTADSPELCVP